MNEPSKKLEFDLSVESVRELLNQLYRELRAYRTKEFQTFIFAFPIIGAGLLPELAKLESLRILLTFFAIMNIFYIVKNHHRMALIKAEIVHLQEVLKLNDVLDHLKPKEWPGKPFVLHLGTGLYVLILTLEMAFLWFWFNIRDFTGE